MTTSNSILRLGIHDAVDIPRIQLTIIIEMSMGLVMLGNSPCCSSGAREITAPRQRTAADYQLSGGQKQVPQNIGRNRNADQTMQTDSPAQDRARR